MRSREQALNVIQIHEQHKTGGSQAPISVTWADPGSHSKKKAVVECSKADNRMLFFAKVHRSATEEQVKTLFSKFGEVYDVNLFRAFQGAPTTKGCGLVTMGAHESAVAVIHALDNKYVWEGMDAPMVAKWMDTALQRRRREQHLAAMRQGLVPGMAMGPDGWVAPGSSVYGAAADVGLPQHARMGMGMTAPGVMMLGRGGMMGGADVLEMQETPPVGCARDAIKLFAGNIPKSCTEEQLMPFFEIIGKVVELVIVRDKVTQESKGSAFIWYATRSMAERAILQFNLRHVLPDASNKQDRPLVVRRAKARVKPMLASVMHPAVGMLTGGGGGPPQIMNPRLMDYTEMMQGQQQQQALHASYYPHMTGMSLEGVHAALQPQSGAGQHGGMSLGAPYHSIQQHHLVGLQGAGGSSMEPDSVLYDMYGQGGNSDHMDGSYPMQVQPMRGGRLQDQVAISISLNPQQLNSVNGHMYSVQAMSAAQLHVMPGAPGIFHLVVSGSKDQVDMARNLLSTIISPA